MGRNSTLQRKQEAFLMVWDRFRHTLLAQSWLCIDPNSAISRCFVSCTRDYFNKRRDKIDSFDNRWQNITSHGFNARQSSEKPHTMLFNPAINLLVSKPRIKLGPKL
jgi:hypothetical protein